MIQLNIPYPPSVNHYWRHVGPHVLISQKGREYRERVVVLLAAWGVRPMSGHIRVTVDLYPPDRRRRDCDNAMKALLDSLQKGGAYHDDSQIVRLEIEKHHPAPAAAEAKAVVKIEEWDEPA